MDTIAEPNLIASFDLDHLKDADLIAEHIAPLDFVLKSNHKVKTTWVEGHSQALFWEDLSYLMSLCHIVPNADRFVT